VGSEPGGVIEQDLVRAGLDQQRWQPGEVGEDRADELPRWVAVGQSLRLVGGNLRG
jgi:hypothetical protein